MDITTEKLPAPIIVEPTKTETIDADTMYWALYCDRLEQNGDSIITAKEDKNLQGMIHNAIEMLQTT